MPSPIMPNATGQAFSISKALQDWHGMICGQPNSIAGRAEPSEADSAASKSIDTQSPRAEIAFFNTPISKALGDGSMDLIAFDEDFLMLGMRGKFHQHLNYQVMGEGWTRLHFRKAARTQMDFAGIGGSELEGPLCQILHQPQGVHDVEWIEGAAALDWITLFLRPQMLVDRFRMDTSELAQPFQRLAHGADDFLLKNWSLSAAMTLAMDQILSNPFHGDLRRVHMEAKATELVCLMSQVLSERSVTDTAVKLGARDIQALHEVRRLLAQSFEHRPSLEHLSRQVGINRNKLTFGFRHLFGSSISEFCLELRLQEACRLLHETTLPVALIAERTGYAQAAAFSNAIRQRFGQTPLQVRKG
ncbi:MAG: AraC family transcriptional regulator [Xanthomonadales bacterium]|nr:AraC family transcriptional regulator [Xanthomonadales bacterium]